MALSRTSKKVGDKLVGTITSRATGPNESDQLKSMGSTRPRQSYADKNSGSPMIYSHHH